MATKKCPNGHQYDSSIYGDNCPFCPSSTSTHTVMNDSSSKTKVTGPTSGPSTEAPTVPFSNNSSSSNGGATVIRRVNGGEGSDVSGRRLVGMLVSYDTNPLGEVFKVFEGRNILGRAADCDLVITNDSNVSSHHLLILYVEAEGVYWVEDQHSSNGTYINGHFSRGFTEVHSGDVIIVGATKMLFFAIPKF